MRRRPRISHGLVVRIAGASLKILLVEDDERLGRVLRQGFREQGIAVDLRSDGVAGLELAISENYDVMVLDLMLPRKTGLDVLRELRTTGRAVPVLILTARSSIDDRVRGLNTGADDYLAKPFEFIELLARVRAITRRPLTAPALALQYADLEMNLSTRRATRSGKPLDLTAKEFALLEYLLRKKGAVITRSMIIDHLWGMDYQGDSNLVDVYINHLRRKVDRDFEPKLIRTVRSVGYALEALH